MQVSNNRLMDKANILYTPWNTNYRGIRDDKIRWFIEIWMKLEDILLC